MGGLIKDYRLKKRLSQLEVSLKIGWKDTTRLSKIEQGRVGKPTRETVDKIMNALDLNEQERGEFLLIGGYLPTEEEIKRVRQKTNKLLNEWPYPATVFDFSWRVISYNKPHIDMYQVDPNMDKRILKNHNRILEIILDPELMQNRLLKGEELKKWERFLGFVISQFQHEQHNRTKEKWYTQHIKDLLQNDLFRRLLKEIEETPDPEMVVGKFATKHLINPKNNKKMLNFYLYVVPVIEDPRFEMEMLLPIDLETYQYYHA